VLQRKSGASAGRALDAAACLSKAAGSFGMVGGQVLDIAGEGKALTEAELRQIHALKTGAMIRAAAEIGCIVAGAPREQRDAAVTFAEKVGFAFQVRDDMLDIYGDEQLMGKPVGSDADNKKTTFATLFGLDECARLIDRETKDAIEALSVFPDAGYLAWLAKWMAGREK
jgi:geranylgeranyl diphosphate synthase type II